MAKDHVPNMIHPPTRMLGVHARQPLPVPLIVLRAHLPKIVLRYEAFDTRAAPKELDAGNEASGKDVSGVHGQAQRCQRTSRDSLRNK